MRGGSGSRNGSDGEEVQGEGGGRGHTLVKLIMNLSGEVAESRPNLA